jgi:hypothetical protein
MSHINGILMSKDDIVVYSSISSNSTVLDSSTALPKVSQQHSSSVEDIMVSEVRTSKRIRKETERFISNVTIVAKKSHEEVQMDSNHDLVNEEPSQDEVREKNIETRERIIKSPDKNEYTCLFYGLYNSLRTVAEREALSDGNLEHPSLAFVRMFKNEQSSPTLLKRINEEGYTGEDIRQYLHSLFQRKIIKRYRWKPLHNNWQLSNFFCSGYKIPITIVIFALSVVSDQKYAARKKITIAGKKKDLHPSRVTHEQSEAFLSFGLAYTKRVKKEDRHPHGGALQRDKDNNVYFYDSGKDFVMYEPTIADIGHILTNIASAYDFSIEV